jgi:hypothetical protein
MSCRSSYSLLTVLVAWSCVTGAGASLAEGPVEIGRIIQDPEPYHMQYVLLQGTLKEVKEIEPYYLASGAGCYGAYRLTIEDATGSLPVAVLGICGTPFVRLPPAQVGDHVLIRGQVQAPGHKGAFYGIDGRPVPDANPDELHLVAADIIPGP